MIDPASLSAQRNLVVAPHPDDESLGCGGLIAMLGKLGCRFHTIFVTDGGASHPGSRQWPRSRLIEEREREASQALDRLGIGDQPRTFLRLRDADMPPPGTDENEAARQTLRKIIGTFQPDLALLPWRRDPHRDHRDSWRLATSAIAASRVDMEILEYAIWLDELGQPDDHPRPGEMERVTLNITPVLTMKRDAVAAHVTQTTSLIADDPDAFRLTPETIARLTGEREVYWRPVR